MSLLGVPLIFITSTPYEFGNELMPGLFDVRALKQMLSLQEVTKKSRRARKRRHFEILSYIPIEKTWTPTYTT